MYGRFGWKQIFVTLLCVVSLAGLVDAADSEPVYRFVGYYRALEARDVGLWERIFYSAVLVQSTSGPGRTG